MKKHLNVFSIIVATLFLQNAIAQSVSLDTLFERADRLAKNSSQDFLYVVTDKNIYLPSETIWFAAYLLAATEMEEVNKPDILTVSLVNEDKTIQLSKKYVLDLPMSAGSFRLPDTLSPGSYQLLAYSNMVDENEKPLQVFESRITVKLPSKMKQTVPYEIVRSINNDTIIIKANYKIPLMSAIDGKKKPQLSYQLNGGKLNNIPFDDDGFATIRIAEKQLPEEEVMIHTKTQLGDEEFRFSIPVTKSSNSVEKINFYAGGGDCLEGEPCWMGWESFRGTRAVSAKGFLWEDNSIIDTVYSNNYGMGSFFYTPKAQKKYALQIEGTEKKIDLPMPLSKGWVMYLEKSVVNDTLAVRIKQNGNDRSVKLMVTNLYSQQIEIYGPFEVKTGKNILIDLKQLQKGLHSITLLNDDNKPVSELLFFAHYNQKPVLADIVTNKEEYGIRDSVSLQIQLQGAEQEGIFTLVAVENNRMDATINEDISSYYYTQPFWKTSNSKINGRILIDNKELLAQVLLINGWRKYTWQEIMQQTENVNRIAKKLSIRSKIINLEGGKIKQPVTLMLSSPQFIEMIETEKEGNLEWKPANFALEESLSLKAITLQKTSRFSSEMEVNNPYKKFTQNFLREQKLNRYRTATTATVIEHQVEAKGNTKTLDEVIVTASKSYSQDRMSRKVGFSNECGDYVCPYNILNCSNHSPSTAGTTAPVKGRVYGNNSYPYEGCETGDAANKLLEILNHPDNRIYAAKTFYGMDSASLNGPLEEYLSTLFWQPFSTTIDKKFTTHFHTSDLTGSYIIRVEGLTQDGNFIIGEKKIKVVEK